MPNMKLLNIVPVQVNVLEYLLLKCLKYSKMLSNGFNLFNVKALLCSLFDKIKTYISERL